MKKVLTTISATIGIGLMMCILPISCGGPGQKTPQEKDQFSQNNGHHGETNEQLNKSKTRTVRFDTVSDVYAYLTGNTFVNNNGDRMSFTSDL